MKQNRIPIFHAASKIIFLLAKYGRDTFDALGYTDYSADENALCA